MILFQLEVPDYVDSPWKASLRNRLGVSEGNVGGVGEGEGVRTGIGMQMRRLFLKKYIFKKNKINKYKRLILPILLLSYESDLSV